jgi:hypothetical protein
MFMDCNLYSVWALHPECCKGLSTYFVIYVQDVHVQFCVALWTLTFTEYRESGFPVKYGWL